MREIVSRGFYVHYKGGIYFVTGVASNGDSHDWKDKLVIYETVEGCGDMVEAGSSVSEDTPEEQRGPRFRTVEDFTRRIDWASGLSDAEAFQKGVVNRGQMIPRFQRVVGWENGRPLVLDADSRDGTPYLFVPQIGNHTGIYEPRMGTSVLSKVDGGVHGLKKE